MEQKKRKVLEYLYQRAINSSGNKKSKAKDNKDILIGENIGLSMIGINYENDFNQLTVRIQFNGSGKFYTLGVNNDQDEYWFGLMREFITHRPEVDFDSLDTDTVEQPPLSLREPVVVDCEVCHGSGMLSSGECYNCEGEGKI